MIARKAAVDRIYHIAVLDDRGELLAATGSMERSFSDQEFFRYHRTWPSHEAFVGSPIQRKGSGDWIVTVSRRFDRPDGSFGGVVFAGVDATYFAKFYREFDIGGNGIIELIRTNGLLIARNLQNESYTGSDISHTPLFSDPAFLATKRVFNHTSPEDQIARVAAYQRSDHFPLMVLASQPQDEVLAAWRRAAIARMLFVLGLVVLIAILGVYLVRYLSRGQRLALELAASEANFRLLAEGSSDIVGRLSPGMRVEYASPSTARIIGWRPDQVVGTDALAGINPQDLPRVKHNIAALKRGEVEEARVTYRLRHREKSEIWVETTLRASATAGGEIDGFITVSRDITKQKDLEEKLEALATIDGLTGLANRRRFDERLQEEWGRAYRERTCLALLMIDVDHFKAYNDAYGHQAGDGCLRAVARILAEAVQRTTDFVARYGGEEFAILLSNTDAARCVRVAERIRQALAQAAIPHPRALPFRQVTASLGGATCWPGIDQSAVPASLIEAADRALYDAKHSGRDRLVMANPSDEPFPARSAAR
jgi:diguanylate cyclase (GGDEF)-like protein/PAS domain S-box-containing protein